eukprot:m.224407 g.224407  ORF g.224407 m.224407 type:complete len:791 (-) comp33428_c2_seq3:304-2676(-)
MSTMAMFVVWLVSTGAGQLNGPPQQCGSTAGVIHITNPGRTSVVPYLCGKLNTDNTCDASMIVACHGLLAMVPPNITVKYYNTSLSNTPEPGQYQTQAVAFKFWSTQPMSYHALNLTNMTTWTALPAKSEPDVVVPYPPGSLDSVLCDTSDDCPEANECVTTMCRAPPQPVPPTPQPTPAPVPPLPFPVASACGLVGAWEQNGAVSFALNNGTALPHPTSMFDGGRINITAADTKVPGAFDFVCTSSGTGCPGQVKSTNGTGLLSTTDDSVTITTFDHQTFEGVVNNTYVCDLVTFLNTPTPKPGEKAATWQRKTTHPSPPLDLSVTMATYLGSQADPFVPVALAMSSDGNTAFIGGNGPHRFGTTPRKLLPRSHNATTNASIVVLDVSTTKPTVKEVYWMGQTISHISAKGSYIAAAGDFGVGLLTMSTASGLEVVWHDTLPLVERGPCGLCCREDFTCRTSVGTDGTLAVVIPAGETASIVATFDANGKRLGSHVKESGDLTDVEVVNSQQFPNHVAYTWFYPSATGREPMVMPGLSLMDYTLTKELYRLWPWGSGHPYRQPGPCDGDVADSRALRVKWSSENELLFVGRSDGGNGIFGCQTRNVLNKAAMIGYDGYSQSYNMQSQAISYLGKLKADTGQILYGQLALARLPDGIKKGNTLHTTAVAEDKAGNIYYAQTAACCIQNMANLTVQKQPLLATGDGMALMVVNRNFSQRLLWHHFASPTQVHGAGSSAVDLAVAGGNVVAIGTTSQTMVEVNPLPGSKVPTLVDGNAPPQQGYLVVFPSLG